MESLLNCFYFFSCIPLFYVLIYFAECVFCQTDIKRRLFPKPEVLSFCTTKKDCRRHGLKKAIITFPTFFSFSYFVEKWVYYKCLVSKSLLYQVWMALHEEKWWSACSKWVHCAHTNLSGDSEPQYSLCTYFYILKLFIYTIKNTLFCL